MEFLKRIIDIAFLIYTLWASYFDNCQCISTFLI